MRVITNYITICAQCTRCSSDHPVLESFASAVCQNWRSALTRSEEMIVWWNFLRLFHHQRHLAPVSSSESGDDHKLLCSRCNCDRGWTGKNCDRIYHPCNPSPCSNDGVCTQTGRYQYNCSCPSGKWRNYSEFVKMISSLAVSLFPYLLISSVSNCQNCQSPCFVWFMSRNSKIAFLPSSAH